MKLNKRYDGSAFMRLDTRPESSVILATEFNGIWAGSTSDIITMWPTLSFGWSASPGDFQTPGDFATQRRRSISPNRPDVDCIRSFHSVMFADDAILADVDIGDRLNQVASSWGDSCRVGLGETSVSETKKRAEGTWGDEQIVLIST